MLGLYHRVDGIYGYQNQDMSFQIILRTPKNKFKEIQVIYDDPFAWEIDSKTKKYAWVAKFKDILILKNSDSEYDYYETSLKSFENRFKYFFILKDNQGNKFAYGEEGFKKYSNKINGHKFSFSWAYSSTGKYISAPEWWKATTWYQIFPDRFFNKNKKLIINNTLKGNNDFQKLGGNIEGIIEKIDYIKDLGFTGIYLNPIFKAKSNHKYDTTDYLTIDSEFGTEKDFKRLIKACHKKNIKVMLDGVFNHCGSSFKQWIDVIKNKDKSKYKDWFIIEDINKVKLASEYKSDEFIKNKPYSTFAHTPFMPRFNWANLEFRKYIKKVIKKWTSMGIDAWRLDVADEPSFDFWRFFKNEVNKINSDVVILGEVWYDSLIFLHGDQFDSVMNYPFRNNAFNYFINQEISLKQFKNNHIKQQYLYSKPINNGLFNLLGSHDTERIISMAKGKQPIVNAMFTWMLLNPGSPSIYYGDEHNLESTNNEDLRRPMDWNFDQENKTFKLIKWLLNYRNNNIESIKQGIVFLESKKSIKFQLSNNDVFEIDKDNNVFINNNNI